MVSWVDIYTGLIDVIVRRPLEVKDGKVVYQTHP
jgi:hypothetical protein